METKRSTSSSREIALWRAFKATLAIAAWTAAIFAVISLYQNSSDRIGYDFYQFWVGGDVLRTHAAGTPVDLYSDTAFREIGTRYQEPARTHSRRQREAAAVWHVLYTASTPFFYWVFSVTIPGDYDRMFNAYRCAALACLVASISAVGWRLRYSIAGIGTAVALAAISAPVASDFLVTNVNCPQLAACLVYIFLRDWARRRSTLSWILNMAAGLLMGMLIAFKPNLLLVPLLLAYNGLVLGRRRAVAAEAGGLVLGLAGAIAVSSWRFGDLSCWWEWAKVIRRLGSGLSMPSKYGNISLSRSLYELTGRNFFVPLTMILLLVAAAAIWRGRRSAIIATVSPFSSPDAVGERRRREFDFRRDLTLFGIAATITFMASGLAWLHYPILIFPFLMVAARRGVAQPTSRASEIVRNLLVAAIILLLMVPPAKPLESYLPQWIEISSIAWVRCTQMAILLSFGVAIFGALTDYHLLGIRTENSRPRKEVQS